MEDRCVSCGTVIPEGRQICPNCLASVPPKKETELKPCNDAEEIKKQANRYITHIFIEMGRFQTHNSFQQPTVIMSRDVFDILQAGTERALYVNTKFQTIFGCKVDIVSGTQKLYVGLNLLEQESRQ